eukprot:CAMPEP_0167768316 /NCGR_PEP_ID=MMETSP0110_2-20121227/16572_1 /TAXON_ID=629695 /ORGANISM="Gymnochlora sp., Strain CCMP2014" /LENGTH=152 /DNA_ID=CAMNT_0007656921 /DNA_START=135 /DNA_END=590 /DNA_ORIENTATION=-
MRFRNAHRASFSSEDMYSLHSERSLTQTIARNSRSNLESEGVAHSEKGDRKEKTRLVEGEDRVPSTLSMSSLRRTKSDWKSESHGEVSYGTEHNELYSFSTSFVKVALSEISTQLALIPIGLVLSVFALVILAAGFLVVFARAVRHQRIKSV